MRRVSMPVSASSSATTGPRVRPSKGLPCNALACSTNWPPPAFARAGFWAWWPGSPLTPLLSQGQALAAELVRRPGLAFADAFDLGSVQRIDLGATLPVILKAHPHRQGEQVGKVSLERLVARDLAPDVADHAAQPDAQKFERTPGPLELVGMRVAPDHDRRALGQAPVALPQRHVMAPGEIDQFFQRAM